MSNQINSTRQLDEQSQAWLNAMLQKTRYCHYFALCFAEDDMHPMGNWNAPFYSIEEASQFKNQIQSEHPDREFMLIEGVLHINGAMGHTPNKFWATWQQQHKARISSLENKGASHV